MHTSKQQNPPAKSHWRRGLVVAFPIAILMGAAMATIAIASHSNSRVPAGGKRGGVAVPRTASISTPAFSVLSHANHRRAHVATVGNPPPTGSILVATKGSNEVYAYDKPAGETVGTLSGAEICLYTRRGEIESAAACSPRADAEREGVDLIHLPSPSLGLNVAVLVPNGVPSVAFTDRDGSLHTIAVTNNVAIMEDPNLASFHYVLPDGTTRVTNVQGALSGRTNTPSAAGSCQPATACR